MTAKEKAIREAWGDKFEELKDHIDENGWCHIAPEILITKVNVPFEQKETHIIFGKPNVASRPKSLGGIDNNNGWISVEEHGLPKDQSYKEYHIITKMYIYCDEPKNQNTEWFGCGNDDWWLENVSHYQQVIKLKPPIY